MLAYLQSAQRGGVQRRGLVGAAVALGGFLTPSADNAQMEGVGEMESIVDREQEFELNSVRDIENEIAAGLDARGRRFGSALLDWMRKKVGDDNNQMCVADLVIKSPKTVRSADTAAILLRCLDAGVLPEADNVVELPRSLVSLCEQGLPELYSYLKVDPKGQTYVKYEAVKGAHASVCKLLSPLLTKFSDLDSALANRKPVQGALNHSVVRTYCEVFDLQSVKSTVEEVFYCLKSVHVSGPNLLQDINLCKEAVERGKRVAETGGTFLHKDYLRPLLRCVESALDSFVKASKGKFFTSIRPQFNGALQKKYPLHEECRSLQIAIPFSNLGPGLATSLRATIAISENEYDVLNPAIHLGNVPPGDFVVTVDVVVKRVSPSLLITIMLEWGEIGEYSTKSSVHEVRILAQRSDVDWNSKEYWQPYSSDPAEGENFVGRQEKVKGLAAKLLRYPLESFYITGQKRVGKTSLALACIDFAKAYQQDAFVVSSYNIWGSFAHEDPRASIEALGREIEDLVKRSVDLLRDVPATDLSGSLSGLSKLFDKAMQVSPKTRFIIVIDEFDEIHQELYLQGNLAETFFANLRAISRCKNVSLVLVGGENMPFVMERQGQKLNNFTRVNLNYYDREKEWSDFRLMVESPTSGVLDWHEDAVGEIFNSSNGNPYFAKVLCAQVLESAVRARDTDVTYSEVARVVQSHISTLGSHSFAHLWQDGIPRPVAEREPEILLRIRGLVALARCFQLGQTPTLPHIFECRGSSDLSEAETAAVLRDFVRRDVLAESMSLFSFQLPIFELWLVDVGASQLAANSLTAELAHAAVLEELAASVRAEELSHLVSTWPAYRGRHIGVDEVRSWLQQVPSQKEQRLLFEILKRVRIMAESKMREMFEQSFSFLQPLPEFVIRKRSDRRRNVIVTYVDGEGKSGQSHASMFAEMNLISSECIFPPGEFEKRLAKHKAAGESVDVVVVVDDLVGTGRSLLSNVSSFIDANNLALGGVPVKIISLLSTFGGHRYVLDGLQKLSYANVDFRPCEIIGDGDTAFPQNGGFWVSVDDLDRAKALCESIGRRIYKQNPLGYGGSGLMIVFPTNCPNNSLPLLHSPSRAGSESWKPLFTRVTH